MKITQKVNFRTYLFFCLGAFLIASCNKKEKKEIVKVYNAVESKESCLTDPSWFPHNQTPAPLEGTSSPFNNGKTVSNLDFHKWSWQKFLWLTKPTSITRTLEIKEGTKTKPLIVLDTIPLFLIQDSIIQIDNAMRVLTPPEGTNVALIYNQQACSNGVLTTNPDYNNTNNKAETILYSLHTSPIMMNAAQKFLKEMSTGELDSIKNFATFPVGSLELKASWVVTSAIPSSKLKNYYKTMGAISTDNGVSYTPAEVAFLGMHVVGVVENHPEFIWATFEHDDMAPNYNWKKKEATSSDDKLLFKKGSTTGIDGIKWDNTTSSVVAPYEAYDLFQYGVPKDSVGGFMVTSQTEPINFDNISDINTCVQNNLNDVFANYFYNGSVWLDTENYLTTLDQAKLLVDIGYNISSALPKGATTSVADSLALGLGRGSLNCANVTMETFTQTFKSNLSSINVNNLANCFSCHSSPSFENSNIVSPLYLSHIFDAAVQINDGHTDKEIEAMKNKQAILHFINKE